MIIPIAVKARAKITDNLKPYISLANTSLPLSSVPRRLCADGGDGLGCELLKLIEL